MCFATPPAPSMPQQMTPPPAPASESSVDVRTKQLRQQIKTQGRKGMASTLLTSPGQEEATTNSPLIGG